MSEWHFKTRACQQTPGWLAWCARTAELGNGPMDVHPRHDVHFKFGETEEEALQKLRAWLDQYRDQFPNGALP